MKFEILPNEILILCFEYLNAIDIFYSFDGLNDRLNRLIRNLSKSKFDRFCVEILSHLHIKQQIHSLYLSNNRTCGQIQSFLSYFSFHEFSHLQSLHSWFTEYSFSQSSAHIYTIPYIFKEYLLSSTCIRSCQNSINNFDNVINLMLFDGVFSGSSQYYFSNVTSLTVFKKKRNHYQY